MGGAHRESEVARQLNDDSRNRLGIEPLGRLDLIKPRTDRSDDSPAANVVPVAMARAAATITQKGTLKGCAGRKPPLINASVMMPMVFWASFVP